MKDQSPKLRHLQAEESIPELRQSQQQNSDSVTFNSVEELLRHDAAGTLVPPSVAVRLEGAIAGSPPSKSWWQKFFVRS